MSCKQTRQRLCCVARPCARRGMHRGIVVVEAPVLQCAAAGAGEECPSPHALSCAFRPAVHLHETLEPFRWPAPPIRASRWSRARTWVSRSLLFLAVGAITAITTSSSALLVLSRRLTHPPRIDRSTAGRPDLGQLGSFPLQTLAEIPEVASLRPPKLIVLVHRSTEADTQPPLGVDWQAV
ncbi:hypothetical protein BU16DRAFT_31958 [Lophium mytilinum]|uniref:Uncharacterized protein n=1 Tax=Lophium mytilinum TaxID=390894 RepID=A0A6A6RFI2_9PEZI|nr:hypothetical protein BU16DRAFT_31958 [Lophium mytilinum]